MSQEIYFSSNYRDLCQEQGTGAGFQFEFSCSRCSDTWRSPFEPYTSARMAGWVSKAANAAWRVMGTTGNTVSSAAEGLAGAHWGTARDAAFTRAIDNAKGHFNRCPRCTSYVCARCFNTAHGLCLSCAPDTAAEAVAASHRGLNDAVTERAYTAGQQNGQSFDVTTPRQLVCPQCRAETHGTPFCPDCGFRLAQPTTCPSCSTALPETAAFCPTCGTRR
jgi:hypothetical protein